MIKAYLNLELDKFLNDANKVSDWADLISQPLFKEAISLLSKDLLNQSVSTLNFNEMAANQLKQCGVRDAILFLTDVLTGKTEPEEINNPEPTYQENPLYDNNISITSSNIAGKPTTKSRKSKP